MVPVKVILDPIRLRNALAAAGISQGELARRSGLTQPQVARMCRMPKSGNLDDLMSARLSTLGKMLRPLGLNTVEALLRYVMPEEPRSELESGQP